jgi:hypothetical protein
MDEDILNRNRLCQHHFYRQLADVSKIPSNFDAIDTKNQWTYSLNY